MSLSVRICICVLYSWGFEYNSSVFISILCVVCPGNEKGFERDMMQAWVNGMKTFGLIQLPSRGDMCAICALCRRVAIKTRILPASSFIIVVSVLSTARLVPTAGPFVLVYELYVVAHDGDQSC